MSIGHDIATTFQTIYFIGENATYDIDALIGGDEPGTLVGTPGNDTLTGTSGSDILRGGFGNDMLLGGAGSDTYKFSAGEACTMTVNYGSRRVMEKIGMTHTKTVSIDAGGLPSGEHGEVWYEVTRREWANKQGRSNTGAETPM